MPILRGYVRSDRAGVGVDVNKVLLRWRVVRRSADRVMAHNEKPILRAKNLVRIGGSNREKIYRHEIGLADSIKGGAEIVSESKRFFPGNKKSAGNSSELKILSRCVPGERMDRADESGFADLLDKESVT